MEFNAPYYDSSLQSIMAKTPELGAELSIRVSRQLLLSLLSFWESLRQCVVGLRNLF
jgi:hypothetical protein